MDKLKLVKIENVGNSIEASIIKDILLTEGIKCEAVYKNNAEYMKLLTGNIMATDGIDILVEEVYAAKALEIIKAYRESLDEDR